MFDAIARITVIAFLPVMTIAQQIIGRRAGVQQANKQPEPPISRIMRGLALLNTLPYVIGATKPLVFVPVLVRAFGLVLIAAGMFVSGWSQRELATNWVPGVGLHKNHKLTTSGPYARVRHPLYAGLILGWLGATVASADPLFGIGAMCFAVSLLVRIPHEEMLLSEKFRKDFDAYRLNTGWLLPSLRSSPRPFLEPLIQATRTTSAPSGRPKTSNRSKKKRTSKRRRP